MTTAKSKERHIIATVIAKAGYRDEVKELLLDLVGPARNEPDCLYYEVYQDESAPDTFRIVDGWASDQAVLDHVAHPNVAHVTKQLAPLVVSSTYVTSLRVSDPR